MNKKIETISINVSDYITKWCEDIGVTTMFLIPGNQIEPFANSIAKSKICQVVACHELGAAFMADGFARASNGPAVVCSIGGPGALYMLPAATVARIDNSSVIFITGDIPTRLYGVNAFQDTGINGSRDSILYESSLDFSRTLDDTKSIDHVLKLIEKRIKKNLPSHLVIPYDIQKQLLNISNSTQKTVREKTVDDNEIAKLIAQKINSSNRPLLLVGHRLKGSNNSEMLTRLVEKTGMPVATTFGAKGILPESHPCSVGNFGFAGKDYAKNILHDKQFDLLIAIGTNLGQRETLNYNDKLKPNNRLIVRVDINESVSENKFADENYLVDDFEGFLATLINEVHNRENISLPLNLSASSSCASFTLGKLMSVVQTLLPESTTLVVDSGHHRISAGNWLTNRPNSFFSSDILAPMGWGICAAIGIKMAKKDEPLLVLTGDGCMRMHGMEIATAVRYEIPIIYLISNNGSYKSVELRLSNETTKNDLSSLPLINWVDFGRTLGADGMVIKSYSDLRSVLPIALNSKVPFILDIRLDNDLIDDHITVTSPWPEY